MEFDFKLDNFADNSKFGSFGGNIFVSPTPDRVKDFSRCRNILPAPRNVAKKLKNLSLASHVDPEYKKAKANLAQLNGVHPENIAVETNVFSLTDLLVRSLKVRSAMVVSPCDTYYKYICRQNSCDVTPFVMSERSNFVLNADSLIDSISTRYDALIISNPNNITGRVIPRSDMLSILDFCQSKGIYVIVDESYMDFVPNSQSVVGQLDNFHNAVVMRCPAPFYNVSSTSAAYAVASSEVVDVLSQNQLPYHIDAYGNALLESVRKDDKFELKTKKWVFSQTKSFVNMLSQLKSLKILHSDCNIILIKLDEVLASTVYNRLLKSNILIRDASSVAGLDGSYIQICVRDKKSNRAFADELMRCLI